MQIFFSVFLNNFPRAHYEAWSSSFTYPGSLKVCILDSVNAMAQPENATGITLSNQRGGQPFAGSARDLLLADYAEKALAPSWRGKRERGVGEGCAVIDPAACRQTPRSRF